jgi:4-hydroxybenzoate polyprenyltransferase
MRPHQWAKNLLIFVPILTSHSYMNETTLLSAILAFVAFSLCASGVYFLNDILDMDADRRHETKRNRPLASGNLPIPYGVIGTIILPLAAFAIAGYFLSFFFIVVLAAYLVLTILYSFVLKSISTADVMTLGILYTLRVIAGAAATGIVLSSWLAAFSIFLFVSLAYLKRYIEVADIEPEQGKIRGRGYTAFDTETMFSLGIENASVSVLVFALYLNSSEVTETYSQPQLLWLLCILLLYWTNRIWVGARRGKITEDPVVFAVKDRVSRMIGIAFICIVFGAKHINVEIGN